jgi:hypothetical protein
MVVVLVEKAGTQTEFELPRHTQDNCMLSLQVSFQL